MLIFEDEGVNIGGEGVRECIGQLKGCIFWFENLYTYSTTVHGLNLA